MFDLPFHFFAFLQGQVAAASALAGRSTPRDPCFHLKDSEIQTMT